MKASGYDNIKRSLSLQYETFRPAVNLLKNEVNDIVQDEDHQNYLGSGSNGSVFFLEGDETYVVKLCYYSIESEIEPLIRGLGIEGVSQIVAYSLEDQSIIMERLPGTDITQLESKPNYTDDEIANLIKKVAKLNSNDLGIDPRPTNFLYSTEKGFLIADYAFDDNPIYTLEDQILDLDVILSFEKCPESFSDPFGADGNKLERYLFGRDIQRIDASLKMLNILKDGFPVIFESVLERNEEKKLIENTSYTDVGFFNKQELREIIQGRVKNLPDKDELLTELEVRLEELEALGF